MELLLRPFRVCRHDRRLSPSRCEPNYREGSGHLGSYDLTQGSPRLLKKWDPKHQTERHKDTEVKNDCNVIGTVNITEKELFTDVFSPRATNKHFWHVSELNRFVSVFISSEHGVGVNSVRQISWGALRSAMETVRRKFRSVYKEFCVLHVQSNTTIFHPVIQ